MTYRKLMSDAIREVQEATQKPYVSMSMGGQYNVLDKDGKVAYSTRDKTLAYDYFKKNFDKLKEENILEDGHQDVSSSKRMCRTIVEDAQQIEQKLNTMSNEDSLDTWWTNKLAVSANNLNKARDYIVNDVTEETNLLEISDKLKLAVLKKKIKQYKDKVFKKTMSTVKSPLFAGYEEVEEGRMKDIFTADQEGKSAEEIAKLMKLPLSTVKNILGEEVFEEQILEFTSDMIKRLKKSYSTMPQRISTDQANALSRHLDRLDLVSLKQLAKEKIPFITTLARNKIYKKTGKFEEVQEAKIISDISGVSINKIKQEVMPFNVKVGKVGPGMDSDYEVEFTGSEPNLINYAKKHLDFDGSNFSQLKKHLAMEEVEEPKKDMPDDKEKVAKENQDKEIAALKDQIAMLKTKLENEKNKAVKPEPNPKTGEVPLTVGVAYKHFKDEEKKEDVSEKVMTDKEKRIQRAKDMIKYYDAQKKAALKGKNKDLAKKMLKNDIEETVSIKAYKNAVDPSKKGLMISKSGGMSGTIMIKDKKELKDLETKLAQAKRLYNIKEMAKDDAYAIGMAQAKKSMNDEPPLDKKTITKGHEIAKKILKKENTSAFNPSVHNKTLGVTTKDLDRAFKKLSNQAQSYVNELLRTGMGTRDAIKKAKQRFNENNVNEERRLYVEAIAGLQKKADKSGMPYSILKKVYDRGMAAWKSGHRPGASQQQWAYARVNSFVTKSSGTWGGADKDLAKQVRGK